MNQKRRSPGPQHLARVLIAGLIVFLIVAFWNRRVQPPEPAAPAAPPSEIAELTNLGVAYLENLDFAKADAAFVKLVEQVPSERLGYQNLAVSRLLSIQPEHRKPNQTDDERQKAVEAVAEAIRSLVEKFPTAADGHILSARLALHRNDTQRAIDELKKAADAHPDEAGIQYELYVATRDAADEALAKLAVDALKRTRELAPQNLFVLTEWLALQAKRSDPKITDTLAAAQQMLAPFVEKVQKFGRFNLNEQIEKTLQLVSASSGPDDAKTWNQVRSNLAILVNVLRPEVARQLDEKRVLRHALEFVVHDFSPAYHASAKLPQPEFAPEVAVRWQIDDAAFPETAGAKWLRLADFDLDGRVDLCLLHDQRFVVFAHQDDGSWREIVSFETASPVRGAILFDIDRDRTILQGFKQSNGSDCADSSLDVVLWGEQGLQTLKNELDPETKTRRLAIVKQDAAFEGIQNVQTALPVDFDHDGDLDLIVSGESGLSLWINRDDFSFADATRFSSLPPGDSPITSMIAVDWNRNVSIDVLCLGNGVAGVLENVLHGQFRWQPFKPGDFSAEQAAGFAVTDADANFSWDLLIGSPQSVVYAPTSNPDAGVVKFLPARRLDESAAAGIATWDYDNDGYQDVLTWSESKLRVLRGGPSGQFKPVDGLTVDLQQAVTAADIDDIDSDGDLDVAALTPKGVVLIANSGGNTNKSLRLPIRAEDAKEAQRPSERVNMHGVGSVIELKVGLTYVPQVVTRQWTHFGMGQLEQGDALRVLWTNGIPEQVVGPKPNLGVCLQQKLKGSCPYLYTWDGRQFAFFTDCLWAAPVGLQVAEGVLAPCRDWEYLKIDGERLAARDGQYVLSMTEELWEIGYIDSVRLLAVDHPRDVQVFSNEKVGPADIAEFKIHTVRQPKPPVSAVDQQGRNILPRIARADDDYVRVFDRRIKQGLTEPHYIELNLGKLEEPNLVKLFLTGWIRPTDTSLNVAISQRPDLEPTQPPSVWVPDAAGEWKQVRPFMGFPGGKTKTIVIDLSGLFTAADYRVRIATTMEVYWDQVFFTVDEPEAELRVTEMPFASANLRYRGFSERTPHPGFGPERYDYSRLAALESWPPLDGKLTAYGDVSDLVRQQDNQQATLGAGDELELRFMAAELDLPDGWTRDFILHNVGWDKDADLNTVFGQSIEPLPFVGMNGYPDPDGPTGPSPSARQQRIQNRSQFWRAFFDEQRYRTTNPPSGNRQN